MSRPQPLTFVTLDGLAFAAERSRLSRQPPGLQLTAGALGPFLELTQLAASGLLPTPNRASWLALDGVSAFCAALTGGRRQWVCPTTRRLGFFRTAMAAPSEETPWIRFALAAQKAAAAVGFPSRAAAQLVGALGEMQSNIYEHSGAPGTGLVAFKASSEGFEFVIADRGVGVLNSLKSCAEYADLRDHGDALRLALTDGVSRFGCGSNRGRGFRPLFVGLANLNGALRFRSGDHALIIDGQSPSLMTATPAQKPAIRGFLASVVCQLDGDGGA